MEIETVEVAPQQEEEFKLDYDLLEEYYRSYFPVSQMVQWLSYPQDGDDTYFTRREFSFTLQNEVYLRYQMYNSEREFKNALLQKVPEKIDIGAVYDRPGKKGDDIKAKEKEFVIDIDMTDYDHIRTCCSKAKICEKCWKFMRVACDLISKSLDEDFGFQHVLWVYSGRRGIHAWVCDKEIRKANDYTRASIIDYLNILVDNSIGSSYVKPSLLKMEKSHLIERNAMKQLNQKNDDLKAEKESEKVFVEIVLREQNLFMKKPEIILEFLAKRSENLSKEVEKEWKTLKTSEQRYEALKELVSSEDKKKTHYLLEELRIWLLYPRLDVNVSKSTNHLLKSPFCIHPKTGNVCVPFTTEEISTFDPFSVPNISTLTTEEGSSKMKNSLKIFNKFLENLKKDV
ncbi:DNA primase (macronuclear) [Tetrahymena thermophila SB210]|uniref:DNA primase n=1 Tax=Tetrahymena thermophila (strain SB210) TaxID=312017 RepID=Q24HY6_TETTS|nr:DNA primase [Tetrahymena thermophila SB210]EAS07452.2 DNA primase [Tetrahymena thermophila SB210]7UY8_C Chain C, DNA primase [Tetrahymena thermophila]|eukprot:XP_001027694.2 DNA primase [Tetrahymena thermophila SB210]